MKFAKLDREELLNTVQCLKFVPNLDNDAIKLMEVDKSILEHVTAGKQWVFGLEYSDNPRRPVP